MLQGLFVPRFTGNVCANITPWGTTVRSARIFIMTPPGAQLEALTHMFAEVNNNSNKKLIIKAIVVIANTVTNQNKA